jgi:Na+/H+-dicarboxylate symporter
MIKQKTRDLLFLLSIIFLAIFTGILLDLNEENAQKEAFVPIINQTYKPIVRNIKNSINTRIGNVTRYFKVFLKKLKLM